MSISSIKKILLAGTALVAVTAFSIQAQAVGTDTLTGNATWGNNVNGLPALGTGAGDNVNLATHALLVTNDQTSNDGSANLDTFLLGTVDNSVAGTGALNITQSALGTVNPLAVTIGSVTNTGTGASTMTIVNNNTAAKDVNVTDSGVLTLGGALVLNNVDTTAATTIRLTVTGNAAVTGTTAITSGAVAGDYASLKLNGASNTLTGLVTLTDNGSGGLNTAILDFGTANTTDTLTAGVNAAAAGEGQVLIRGSSAITGNIGTVNALYDVAALGTGVASISGTTNAITIDANSFASLTLTGAVTATNLNINNTGTVNLGNASHAITNTVFTADGTVSLAAGGTLTSAVTTGTTNTGTLTFAGAGTMAGAVGTAAKQLKTINAGVGAVTFSGLANATTLNITGANTVSLNAAAGTNTIGTVALGTFADTLSIAAGGSLSGAVTTGTSGQGTLALVGAGTTVGGNVGVAATGLLGAVTVGGAGADTFTGSVNATTTTLSGASTVALNGGLTGTTLALTSGGTVTLADTKNITTTAITSGANTSTLNIAGTSTVAGTVGAGAAGSGTSLLAVNATGIAGKTATFSNAITANTFSVGAGAAVLNGALTATTLAVGNGSVALNATGNSGALLFNALSTGTATIGAGDTFTGTMGGTGGVAGAGIGNVVFTGASGAGITTIGATGVLKSLTIGGAVSTAGNVLAADTTTLGANTLTAGGTFVAGAGQTIASTINSAGTTLGHVAATGNATTSATTFVNLTSNYTGATQTFTLVSGAGGGSVATLANSELEVNGTIDTGAKTLTKGLYTYSQVITGLGLTNLEILATRNAITTLGTAITANDSALDTALNTISAEVAPVAPPLAVTQYNTLIAAIANVNAAAAVSATAAHNALQSLMPAGADGGAQAASLNVTADIQEIATGRLTALRDGDTTSGVAAGATANGVSMWLEGYGQHANQDTMGGVNGYGATTWGGAVGVDSSALMDKAIVGVAFNYGHSAIDSNDVNTTTTGLDNYGINLYSTYDLGDKMFVNGQAGFAYNKINSNRHNVGGAGGPTADGSTSSDQYSARLDAGRDYPVQGGMTLTPDVSAAYTYLNTAGYTETGAGGLDNTVASNGQNVLGLGIGGTAAWKIAGNDGDMFKPSLHAGYTYEAIDDKVQTSSSFVGDPASTIFINAGASPARSIFDVGAKVVYATQANWDFSANYDFQAKTSYTSNTGELRATAHF